MVSNQFVLAGRGQRLAAYFLDSLLAWIISILLVFIIFSILFFVEPNIAEELLLHLRDIFYTFLMPVVLYLYIYIVFTNGQTWGKKLLKIRVMNQDGSVCTQQHYFWKRMLPFVLLPNITSIFASLFFISIIGSTAFIILSVVCALILILNILMIFRKSRRCWHDDFAKTMVVKV